MPQKIKGGVSGVKIPGHVGTFRVVRILPTREGALAIVKSEWVRRAKLAVVRVDDLSVVDLDGEGEGLPKRLEERGYHV